MPHRQYTLFDQVIMQIENCFHAIGKHNAADRAYPADHLPEAELSKAERQQSAGFMRVNHSGEVCAQALYNAQALLARNKKITETLARCGQEESDHLFWCQQRLQELNSHASYLNLFWYWNSFTFGILAGLAGDRWSLGFVEETEIQVAKHLQGHLERIAENDKKSLAVIQQMQIDETQHAKTAEECGAKELPRPVKKLMALHAKVMTTLAYWI